MKLTTRHFGDIEIDEGDIITFPDGILGFEDVKKYVIIPNPDEKVPFQWLQGVDEPNLAFVITNPFLFKKDYEFDIPDSVVEDLEIKGPEDVITYSIAVVTEDIKDMTINLMAPIIINSNNKQGKQIVLDGDEYSLKYKIFQCKGKEG